MAAIAMRNYFISAALAVLLLSIAPFALAQTYGQCAYNDDVYGSGCASGGGGPPKVTITGRTAQNSTTTTATTTTSTITPAANAEGGLTSDQKQSILGLLASFGADQAAISRVTLALNGQSSSSIAAGASLPFTRDLEMGMTGEDVRALQQYLNAHGSMVAASGDGSLGQETDYFGTLTFRALVAFQNSQAEAILHPLGITEGTGFFGPVTRAYINTFHE